MPVVGVEPTRVISTRLTIKIKVKPQNEKIRQRFAAPDKQHSNAEIRAARATERIAKQARPTLAETE